MTEVSAKDFSDDLAPEDDKLVREMFEAGVHWGRVRSRTHPKMRPYIFSTRGDVEIIDLAETLAALKNAEEFLRGVIQQGGSTMLVGTQPAAQKLVQDVGERLGIPYVQEKWLGGTLTNFKTILSRLDHMKNLKEKIESEEFERYTKRERHQFTEEYNELKAKFQGIREMRSPPAALVLLGARRHDTALREAKRRGIPIIAALNTDDDPSQVDWPIPANENATPSIKFILGRFGEVIEKAWQSAEEAKAKEGEAKTVAAQPYRA